MPNKRGGRKKKATSGGKGAQGSEVPANALTYLGPIRTNITREMRDLHTVVTAYSNPTWGSDSGGVIAPVYGDNPNTVADWASLAACFEEYRVLAHEVSYYPKNRYARGTVTTAPLATVVDRGGAGGFSDYTSPATHASFKMHTLDDPWTVVCQMEGADEATFKATSSPGDTRWIKLYASGLSVSTTYGVLIITYRIQFRGRA